MKLKNIFSNQKIDDQLVSMEISGISQDTRSVIAGELFFVIEGDSFDVFSLLSTIDTGKNIFVVDIKRKKLAQLIIKNSSIIFVEEIKKEFRRVVDLLYPFDFNNFKVIGVTGTNGKTTTASLVYYLLNSLGIKATLIGTVDYYIGKQKIKATHTTPDYLFLRKILNETKKKGIQYVIMEVSSHAIEQGRVSGISFSQCIFTNLSQDHLDYHHNMDSYSRVKKSFFLDNPQALSLININDQCGREIFAQIRDKKYSYGIGVASDFEVLEYNLSKKGSEFVLKKRDSNDRILGNSKLLGKHNLFNIIAALSALALEGFPLEETIVRVDDFLGVEGRMQKVAPDVFIDYAHTPQALESAISALHDISYQDVLTVFGCGGNRDRGKRMIMGNISSELSFFTFITTDNSRNEDPYLICKDIAKGFKNEHFKILIDRKEAIKAAIAMQSSILGSALLIAGKGHEDYQILGEKKISFKDSRIVKKLLK